MMITNRDGLTLVCGAVVGALLFLATPARAYESIPQTVYFDDFYEAFEGVNRDTGWLPANSPIQVRFTVGSKGGLHTSMEANSQLTWPAVLTQGWHGVEREGNFALQTVLAVAAQIKIDVAGYQGVFDIWSSDIELEDEVTFDPLLLPGAPVESVSVSADGAGITPVEIPYSPFTGVELVFKLSLRPAAGATLAGRRIETGDSIVDGHGGTGMIDLPTDHPGEIELSSTYVAWIRANLDLVLTPAVDICFPILGCYEIAAFDIPVNLVGVDLDRPFTPVDYAHPLPKLAPVAVSYDFGEVRIGNLANWQLPVENLGLMNLEGDLVVDGPESFTAFPPDFLAGPGDTDGAVVTFAPTSAGAFRATLRLASSDPEQPELGITVTGTGVADDPGAPPDPTQPGPSGNGVTPGGSAQSTDCGCQSAGDTVPGGLLVGLFALLWLRRRRPVPTV